MSIPSVGCKSAKSFGAQFSGLICRCRRSTGVLRGLQIFARKFRVTHSTSLADDGRGKETEWLIKTAPSCEFMRLMATFVASCAFSTLVYHIIHRTTPCADVGVGLICFSKQTTSSQHGDPDQNWNKGESEWAHHPRARWQLNSPLPEASGFPLFFVV